MSLGNAFSFPFSGKNMNKILQIGLVFGIISALQLGLAAAGQAVLASLLSFVLSLAFTFFLSGYGIFVIRDVLAGNENLPQFNIGASIRNGLSIGLAGLLYWLPVFVLIIVMLIIMFSVLSPAAIDEIVYGINYPGYEPQLTADDEAALGAAALLMCGSMLLVIPFTLVATYAAQIGVTRFAADNDRSALYQVFTNVKLLFSNFGKIGKLFVLQLVIGMAYGVISVMFGAVFGIFGGESMYTETFVNASLFVIAGMVVFNIVTQILGAMQQMSIMYLLAGLADEANFGGKSKNKNDYDFGDDDFTF